MLITYTSDYTNEILVCMLKSEHRLLDEWFADGTGRHLDEYERLEHPSGVIEICAETRIRHGG